MFLQNRNIDFSFTMIKIDNFLLSLADMRTDDAYPMIIYIKRLLRELVTHHPALKEGLVISSCILK